ncbi:MAG: DUF2231 domain-containing protein [Pseudomonadota bacterium]|nr:DUF2231 domain-containing protein [Pseudomonadota bacterium]
MRIIPGWHPMIVHFPLALIVTAAMCLSLARLRLALRYASVLATVGTWNLCVGAVAVYFALGSGLAAVIGLHVGMAAHQAITAHVKSAMLTAVLVTAAAVWRGAGAPQESRPTWVFLLLLWAATAAAVVTGYRGGQNVYRYGVGLDSGTTGSVETPAAASSKRP